jgi:TRAP-type mannitol/chloroaromatic compound transport system substrate-binding protein
MAGQELVLRFMAFKTLDEDEFKTMNNFLDLAMEKIDTKSQDELDTLQDNLIKVLKFSNQVLGEKHKFSRSIASEKRSKMVNLSFSSNNIAFNSSIKKSLFSKNKSLSSISSKQTVKTSNNDKLTILLLFSEAIDVIG